MKKHLLLLSIAMISYNISMAQDKLFAGTGATFSSVKGTKFKPFNRIGYYIDFGTEGVVRKKLSIVAELQFMDQRCKNDSMNFRSNSINLSLYYKYQPFQIKLRVLAGIQMGFISYSRVQIPDITIHDRDVKFSGIAGLAYPIKDFEIIARYNHLFDGIDIFDDSSFQLGVVYKIKNY